MTKMLNNYYRQGQVALVVLLISAVVMTIGLSVSKKTLVDTKVETSQEQLKQAFNAAESGIEYYLGTGSTKFVAIDNNSFADITTKNIGGGTTLNFDQFVLPEGVANFWLVNHTAAGDIDYSQFYTGTAYSVCLSNTFAGAVKVDFFYRNGANYLAKRYGYNLSPGMIAGYSNINPGQGACDANYEEMVLPLPNGGGIVPLLLSVRLIGSGGRMYLQGNGGATFPVQGITISSIGQVGPVSAGTNATGVKRNLEVIRTYKAPGFSMEAITAFGNVLSN